MNRPCEFARKYPWGLALLVLSPLVLAAGPMVPADYQSLSLKELDVHLVTPKVDPKTGFVVGGKNPTALIKQLTELNGKSIAALEKAMRPTAYSQEGFLGKEESLLEVLAGDNQFVVDEVGLSHQELAKHLHVLGAIGFWQHKHGQAEKEFIYHGTRFKIQLNCTRGFQDSPFDDGTMTNTDAILLNLDNGKKLGYSLLVPHMIERYGFYEGKGTSYRVDPQDILAVLDFLKAG